MTDKIEPALTAAEWAAPHVIRPTAEPPTTIKIDTKARFVVETFFEGGEDLDCGEVDTDNDDARRALIAVFNRALPDDDPRKITRAKVDELRIAAIDLRLTTGAGAKFWQREHEPKIRAVAARLDAWADGLESYLSPKVI